ncbi:hypothetical protein ACFYPN_31855 [Streptomyces sp. NPDC005576]
MSVERYDGDAYGQGSARVSHHQHEATVAQSTVCQALAAVGIMDDIM